MTNPKSSYLSNAVTAVMVVCALAMTGLTAYRTISGSPRGAPTRPDRNIAGWEQLQGPAHWEGAQNAQAKLLVFTDLECPACRGFHQATYRQLLEKFPDALSIGYRHFPLPYHEHAKPMAIGAECAGLQGRFTEFLDSAFERQDSLAVLSVPDYAARAGVPDPAAFESCLADSAQEQRVAGDLAAVEALRPSGTPTVLLNGKLFGNVPTLAELEEEIVRLLEQ